MEINELINKNALKGIPTCMKCGSDSRLQYIVGIHANNKKQTVHKSVCLPCLSKELKIPLPFLYMEYAIRKSNTPHSTFISKGMLKGPDYKVLLGEA